MAKFEIGDRVRLRKGIPDLWIGAWNAPKGSAGVVTSVYSTAYAVVLDDDPWQVSAAYGKDELEAES